MSGHGQEVNLNFPSSQAIKDATMAWFISRNLQPGNLFIHFNGAFHSDNGEGINWYLKRYQPGLKIVTISTTSLEDIGELPAEEKGKADFIICVPENMTTTH